MDKIILGVIGGSDGNGHPFSWSAIINGYNSEFMALSGYPIISKYLGEQKWPDAKLRGASVDYIFTPNPNLSKLIAKSSLINNIVDQPSDMLGYTDGLLLARDDAENHIEYAREFLVAGLPIFIDKPIALNVPDLMELWSLQKYRNQIFSCSSLSHSLKSKKNKKLINSVGKLRSINATTPNSWNKYGIHIIEPLIEYTQGIKNVRTSRDRSGIQGSVSLSFSNDNSVEINLKSLGAGVKGEIKFEFCGDMGQVTIVPDDYFSYFKTSLQRFKINIVNKSSIWECSLEHHRRVVTLIEMGK